jgi:hypothetical protein
MRILIVGAGWYGCHLASVLLKNGIEIVIVDKFNAIFGGSSAKNQNRLHLGFHYPRSPETIEECHVGFQRFKQTYGGVCVSKFPNNTYVLSRKDSHVDAKTFATLFDIKPTSVTECLPFQIQCVESEAYVVDEEYIDPERAQAHFQATLGQHFRVLHNPEAFESLGSIEAACDESFDYVLNCTYNHLEPLEYEHYECFLTLLYEIPELPTFGCTIMDGPFFSIYPYDLEKRLYTLTSVKHGVLYAGRDTNHVVSEDAVTAVQARIESELSEFIANFKQFAKYAGYYTSWKTKPVTDNDDRSLRYKKEGRIISMYGGKITGIFQAAENVLRDVLPDAIVGWTGLVGRELLIRLPHAELYNSSNIQSIRGRCFNRIYFAGMPAEKWKINGAPDADYERLCMFKDLLATVQCQHFFLISTVDVLDCTVSQDETGCVYASHPYGRHRRLLELFVAERFPGCHTIVRLPGLFGAGLKKNALYDLIHCNNFQSVCQDSEFQWYDISDLYEDLESWRASGIALIQPVSEPISMRTIVQRFFPHLEAVCVGTTVAQYKLLSVHGIQSAKKILDKIRNFIRFERDLWCTAPHLAISNIAWPESETRNVLALLERYRIRNIEVAYPRPLAGAVSMQSILYGTDIQLFDAVRFFPRLRDVLERCVSLGVKRLVFGSPRQRMPPYDMTFAAQLDYFRCIGDLCQTYDVVFCLEPNASGYGCTWLTTSGAVYQFVRAVNHKHILMNLDTGNYDMENDTTDVESMFAGEWVGHIQVSAPFLAPVHTVLDWQSASGAGLHPIIAAAARHKYDGYISLEMKETSMYNIALSCETAVRYLGFVFSRN